MSVADRDSCVRPALRYEYRQYRCCRLPRQILLNRGSTACSSAVCRRALKRAHTPDPRSKVPCPYLRHDILALASVSFVYERAVGRLIQPSATSQRSQDPISSAYVCLLHTNIAVYVPSSVSILAKYRAQFMIRQSAHGMFFAICEQRQRHETRIYFTGRGIETRELLTV